MDKDTTKTEMGKVIHIDESQVHKHLSEIVRGTVEETLNGLLDADLHRSRPPGGCSWCERDGAPGSAAGRAGLLESELWSLPISFDSLENRAVTGFPRSALSFARYLYR